MTYYRDFSTHGNNKHTVKETTGSINKNKEKLIKR